MREILFRGKRLDCGAWVYGSLVTYKDGAAFIYYPWLGDDTVVKRAVDPSTLGQYAGLKDKCGKRIFEGDIVDGDEFNPDNDGYGVIGWDDGAFTVSNKYIIGTFHENFYGAEFTIIGNIHDNPGLMEVE